MVLYWIKDGIELPSEFNFMDDGEKKTYWYIDPDGTEFWHLNDIEVNEEIYKEIQNCSKEKLLVYMVDTEYKNYLPLIEYRLSL